MAIFYSRKTGDLIKKGPFKDDLRVGTRENYVDGEFLPATKFLYSYDPSVGEVWAKIPDSSAKDVDTAVQAAKVAFKR